MKAVILSGGFGTRLRPLTITRPKTLLPLFGRPFLLYQVELLRKYGIREIIFSLGYRPAELEAYFKDGKEWGVNIKYVKEDKPLGTAGAIKNAEKFLNRQPFLVFNGDILTQTNLSKLIAFHRRKKALATITLSVVEDPTAYGLVKTDAQGKILQFLEKPSGKEAKSYPQINAGIYVFASEVLSFIPANQNFSAERELFPLLLKKKKPLYAWTSKGYWLDMGTLKKYKQVHRDIFEKKIESTLLDKKSSLFSPVRKMANNVWCESGVKISAKARIFGPVFIGKDSKIGKEVEIAPFTVLGGQCSIEEKAKITNSIILEGAKIGKGAEIEGAILGEYCQIGDNARISKGAALGGYSQVKAYSLL